MNRTNALTRMCAYVLTTATVVVFGAACIEWFAIDTECGICRRISELVGREHYGPSWTADGESIVFGYSRRDESLVHVGRYSHGIYIVNSDGDRLTRWVPQKAPSSGDSTVAFDYSPDVEDSTVAFATLRYARKGEREYEIATANLDGSDYRRLTNSDGSDLAPTWSPDGAKIAFFSNRAGFASKGNALSKESFDVYVMDADGLNVRSVAPGIVGFGWSRKSLFPPVWSPDGAYLAFRRKTFESGGHSLYTVDVAPSGTVGRVVVLGRASTEPAWSPDGQWIAFSDVEPNLKSTTIYVAKPNGYDTRMVTRLVADNGRPADLANLSWSPDGSALRFSAQLGKGRSYGIYQIGTDGVGLQEIAEVHPGSQIAWSPDDSRIAALFADAPLLVDSGNMVLGNVVLYVMKSDGSNRRVLVRLGRGGGGPEAANGR